MEFIVVGTTSLARQCAQYVLETQHHITAVCTDDSELMTWCQQHRVRCCQTLQELLVISQAFSIDILLSIVNPFILPKEILQRPNLLAVNYHDSLLPRYAGVHATSWAIFQDEKLHGISWHLMTEGVDTGDLLLQRTFPIDPDETAASLNMKCYEVAMESFRSLLDLLVTNCYQRIPQDLMQRTYYGYDKTIPQAGLVSWTDSTAEDVHRLARAADRGHYENTWGVLKFYVPGRWVHAAVLACVAATCSSAPGTLVAITEAYWEIRTTTTVLRIGQFVELSGQAITPFELAACSGLTVGSLLPSLLDQTVIEQYPRWLLKEKFWLPRLTGANPIAVTGCHRYSPNSEQNVIRQSDSLPIAVWKELPADTAPRRATQRLAAWSVALLVYFFRTGWLTGDTLGYTLLEEDSHSGLLLRALPIQFVWNASDSFSLALERMSAQLSACAIQGPLLTEVFLRYPALASQQAHSLLSPAVVVVRVPSLEEAAQLVPTALMTLAVDEFGQCCLILSDSVVSGPVALNAVVQRLKHLLTTALQQPDLPLGSLPLMTSVEYQQWLQAHRQVEYLPTSFTSLIAVFLNKRNAALSSRLSMNKNSKPPTVN